MTVLQRFYYYIYIILYYLYYIDFIIYITLCSHFFVVLICSPAEFTGLHDKRRDKKRPGKARSRHAELLGKTLGVRYKPYKHVRGFYKQTGTRISELTHSAPYKQLLSIYRLRSLCIEVFKTINNLNPSLMKYIFQRKINGRPVRTQNTNNLTVETRQTVTFGTNSISVYLIIRNVVKVLIIK